MFVLRALALAALVVPSMAHADVTPLETGGFGVEKEVYIQATPEVVFDALTGDVSGWWDHHFADDPKSLVIEPRPGGTFLEVFDDEGNGAKHADVIYAHRPKLLRMVGPLGFSGNALSMVHTFLLEADGDATRLKLSVRGVGQLEEGWAEAVDGLWDHFLVEQLRTWVEDEGEVAATE